MFDPKYNAWSMHTRLGSILNTINDNIYAILENANKLTKSKDYLELMT